MRPCGDPPCARRGSGTSCLRHPLSNPCETAGQHRGPGGGGKHPPTSLAGGNVTGWRAEREPEAMLLPVLLSWFRRQLPASSCCRGSTVRAEWGGFPGFYPVHLGGGEPRHGSAWPVCVGGVRGKRGKARRGRGVCVWGILANSALIGARAGPVGGGRAPPQKKRIPLSPRDPLRPAAIPSSVGQPRCPTTPAQPRRCPPHPRRMQNPGGLWGARRGGRTHSHTHTGPFPRPRAALPAGPLPAGLLRPVTH